MEGSGRWPLPVGDYPNHDFVIDVVEATRLGLQAELAPETMRDDPVFWDGVTEAVILGVVKA
jgi:hypothetical protein